MALKKGICKNYGECDLADDKVEQEAESTDFVCSECGSPLHEITGTKVSTGGSGNGKVATIIIGSVLGLAAIGAGGYFLLGDKLGSSKKAVQTELTEENDATVAERENSTQLESIALSKQSSELKVGATETLTIITVPTDATPTVKWASSDPAIVTVKDGVVTAVAPGTAKIGVQDQGNKELTAYCEYKVLPADKKPATPTSGSVDLGYGVYTGPLKNGKPHGLGTLVYKRTTIINQHDSKYREAHAGESVQGQFVNGTFTIGKHFSADGDLIETLNFGVAH